VVYLRWAQDVASAHWLAAATADEHDAITWIAVRHEIDYLHAAMPGDAIVARTWVGEAEAVRFERHVEIVRAGDDKVLARARTLWCPVRRDTGRITRVSASLRERFSSGPAAG
jgi:acyl-CoA thioester hydrolase